MNLSTRSDQAHFGLIETLFARYRRLPFVSGYVPSVELKSHGVAYVVAVLLLSFALAAIERLALGTIAGYLLLVGLVTGLGVAMAAFDRAWVRPPVLLDLDEAPPRPTTRLDLAG